MDAQTTLFLADWIAPIESPAFQDGGFAVQAGRIVAMGSRESIKRADPNAEVHDFGNAVVLPGLVNAHTHLELSSCTAGNSPGGTFAQWILSMRQRMQNPDATTAAKLGIDQCVRFGVTCVGDITQKAAITRPVLAGSPLRAISFGEVLGLGAFRHRFDELFGPAVDRKHDTPKLKIGLTPHAPYTVDIDGYRACLQFARANQLPLATHLAETFDELTFLQSSMGPFRWVWEQLGTWREGVPTFQGSPIAMAQAVGLLDYPTLLAHVNYCDNQELEILSRGQASVVYCPRTHKYFGHPPHRWREMLAQGMNVAVGTDSCASSPDLNLLDDLRLLRKIAPEIPVQTIWEMGTIRGARALGMQREIGSLQPGKFADFLVFDSTASDPLEAILQSAAIPKSVWIDGKRIGD